MRRDPRSGCRAGIDGSAHRHGPRRTGRRPAWRRGSRRLGRADWRPGRPRHQWEKGSGGPAGAITNEKGQLRFPSLPPGVYTIDIEMPGFATYHETDVGIGAGATIERTAVLKVAGGAEARGGGGARGRPRSAR